MNIVQKITLLILLICTIFISYSTYEFVYNFISVKQVNPTKNIEHKDLPDKINVVLVGSDARTKEERGRSDSLMILQYNRKLRKIKAISIMRDCYVEIPNYKKNKINAAYSFGGIELLTETLKNNFNIEAPYFISIKFQDFIDCINEIFPKGIEINAEKDLDLDGVFIKKGRQMMDGNTLLQYSRFREDEEGDFGRIRRQQQVVKSIINQKKNISSIFKIPKAIGVFLGKIETNLPKDAFIDFGIDFFKTKNTIDTLSIPVKYSWDFKNTSAGSVLDIDFKMNQEAISNFLN
ncbi:LCP family protein [Enterococcus hirae]